MSVSQMRPGMRPVLRLKAGSELSSLRISVLMASFNRRQKTMTAIASIIDSATRCSAIQLSIVLVDDDSKDGTGAAAARVPGVHVLRGTGSLYWAGSMARAEVYALKQQTPDVLLWFNDDVILDDDALARLARAAESRPGSILIGAMRGSQGDITYSGFRQQGIHPLRFEIVDPNFVEQTVATFNGNLVWVPASVVEAIGGIDGDFGHAWADLDYGLRATAAGVSCILMPGSFGMCVRNRPGQQPIWQAWKSFRSIKGGGHWGSTSRFIRRHHTKLHLGFILISYAKWWGSRLLSELKSVVRQLLN